MDKEKKVLASIEIAFFFSGIDFYNECKFETGCEYRQKCDYIRKMPKSIDIKTQFTKIVERERTKDEIFTIDSHKLSIGRLIAEYENNSDDRDSLFNKNYRLMKKYLEFLEQNKPDNNPERKPERKTKIRPKWDEIIDGTLNKINNKLLNMGWIEQINDNSGDVKFKFKGSNKANKAKKTEFADLIYYIYDKYKTREYNHIEISEAASIYYGNKISDDTYRNVTYGSLNEKAFYRYLHPDYLK